MLISKRSLLALCAAGIVSSGCGGGRAGKEGGLSFQLLTLASCDEVVGAMRGAAIAEMRERVQGSLDTALEIAAHGGLCDNFGTDDRAPGGPPSGGPTPAPDSAGSSGSGGGGAGGANQEGGASKSSGTNNQIAGVDEPDFIKNDSKYIYVAAGDTVKIVEAWPAAASRVIASISGEGEAKKLFITEDRLVVYASLPIAADDSGEEGRPDLSRECTYGYTCDFTGDGHPTEIRVYDITDRAAPALLRKVRASSSLVNARKIGPVVHSVLSQPGSTTMSVDALPTWPDLSDIPCDLRSELVLREKFAELERENIETIASWPLVDLVPRVEDSVFGPVTPYCRGFYASAVEDGFAITSVLSLDLSAEVPLDQSSIVSRPGAVYASAESLYLAVPHQQRSGRPWFRDIDVAEASTVHKFTLTAHPAGSSYAGSGVVDGHVLNQFSMDEHGGNLRIATSTGRSPDPRAKSTIAVLGPGADPNQLATIGRLGDIAPSEDIRSARFDGDRAFVVTFRNTDPLFVFDLSDPTQPSQRGELFIPGFSTYMHMLDESHLLSIGYTGNGNWFSDVQLQIFDVSDMENPQLAHKTVIDTRGGASEALTNHLAFNYFAPRHLLAVPMTICNGGSDPYWGNLTFSGLLVYDVSPVTGLDERGRVAHVPDASATCYHAWTQAESQVKRSVFLDDFVYSVSGTEIKVNRLDTFGPVAQVPLRP